MKQNGVTSKIFGITLVIAMVASMFGGITNISDISNVEASDENSVIYTIYATREGCVGGTTANGHVILSHDHFVALPSTKVLCSNGGHEYEVKVTYEGKSVIAPVWDVGPWNTKDNYWDPPSQREMWQGLPQGKPEAQAAYQDGYNGGFDETNYLVEASTGSDEFSVGDRVWPTVDDLSVRLCPGGDKIDSVSKSDTGTVIDGPEKAVLNGLYYRWWKIEWDKGLCNWSAQKRYVSNPAGIDLADGTFWDDLGMTDNDWVTVEFLWTTAEDSTSPTVDAFDVTPHSVTLGNAFTISYTVSDTGGSGLKQAELWRANDVGGVPDWDTPDNPIDTTPLSGQTSYSGSFNDGPPSEGTYWYGMHVLDNAGNMAVEPDPPGPIEVVVEPIAYPQPIISVGTHKTEINVGETDWVTFTVTNDGTEYTPEWGIQVRVGDGLELVEHPSYPWDQKMCNDKAAEWYHFYSLNPGNWASVTVGINGKSASDYESVWYTAWMHDPDGQPKPIQYAHGYNSPCDRQYAEYGVTVIADNSPPQLSNGYVDPASGTPSTNFYYYVTYFDPDGDSPSVRQVIIDGIAYTMSSYLYEDSWVIYRYGPKNLIAGGTHYYFFYFEDGKGGWARLPSGIDMYLGPTVSQQTYPPEVTTTGASSITTSSAALWGNLDSTGGLDCQVWFEYGTTTSYGSSTPELSMSSAGPFGAIISSLSPDTTYHFRACASNSEGTRYGSDMTFTTITGQVVTFPDPNLDAAIRQAIGKPAGDIYQSDLQGLTEGFASGKSIVNLSGLEYCVNLRTLYLPGNQISNIEPISKLTNLTCLCIDGNQICDITPLSNLVALRELYIGINPITNIGPLASLNKLQRLGLSAALINDISPLSNLTNLVFLYLDRNQISDVTPLSNLTNLQSLHLGSNRISDVSALSKLTKLTALFLDVNQLTNISSLSLLTKLGESGFEDREGVRICLGLRNNQITDIRPLVGNSGVGEGDGIDLRDNPLNADSRNTYIPQLEARGVNVLHDITGTVTIQGKVTLEGASDHSGISIEVWLNGLSDNKVANTTTTSDGSYQVSNVPSLSEDDRYAVEAFKDGYAWDSRYVSSSDAIPGAIVILSNMVLHTQKWVSFDWVYQSNGTTNFTTGDLSKGSAILYSSVHGPEGGSSCGFIFSTSSVTYPVADVYFGDSEEHPFSFWANNGLGGIHDMGAVALESVIEAPDASNGVGAGQFYNNQATDVIVGHSCCIVTKDGVHYAKIYVTDVGSGEAPQRTWYVDDDKQDYPDADFIKIQEAVDAASAGDTIIVYSGTYTERVIVDKQLILKGVGTPVVDADEHGSSITVKADGCTIEGFHVLGSKPGPGDIYSVAGIRVESDGNTLQDNLATNNLHGIWLSSSSNNNLLDNEISNTVINGVGIGLYGSHDNQLESNDCHSNDLYGIYLDHSHNNNITGNKILNGKYGIGLMQSDCNELIDNNILNNWRCGIMLNSNENTVRDNLITDNGYAISFEPISFSFDPSIPVQDLFVKNVISNNLITNNQYGIYLVGTSVQLPQYITPSVLVTRNNGILNNTIRGNEYGVFVGPYASDNEVYLNNYLDNIIHAYCTDTSNVWNSLESITYSYGSGVYTNHLGNYWSDYAGSDADGDGIGDTPYPIDSDKDNYPLMGPFENYVLVENQVPVASIDLDYAYVQSGASISFDGSNSDDPDGMIVNYEWDFGDGTVLEGPDMQSVEHRFRGAMVDPETLVPEIKNYAVTLKLTDDKGATATDTTSIDVVPLQKTIENTVPPAPTPGGSARMTAYYNWIGVTADTGEDIYIVSAIHFEAEGFVSHLLTVWDEYSFSIGIPAWSEAVIHFWHPVERTFAYPFGTYRDCTYTFDDGYFRGMAVGPSDEMRLWSLNVVSISGAIGPVWFGVSAPFAPDLAGGPITDEAPPDLTLAHLCSPAELRVYDSEGNVTGLVNGEAKEEIPDSGYSDEIVVILNPSDSYWYEVLGTDDGEYGLAVTSVEDGESATFTAIDIPTSSGAVHEYTIDWGALSQDEEGVTLEIDADGDGVFEETITSDATLQPPEAEAGGPYIGVEGSAITFDGSGSADADGSIALYEWDFDGDGVYNISSTSPTIEHTWGDDHIGIITLRVVDDERLTDTDMAEATINNVPPTVEVGPDQTAECCLDEVSFSGNFTDPGWLDSHTIEWDFGDGATAEGSLAVSHLYTECGTFTVTLMVTDDDGGVGTDTATVTVVDTIPPEVEIEVPQPDEALQDGVTLTAAASDLCGVAEVYFYIREPDGLQGMPIGYEDLPATLNWISGKWEYAFDTTQLPDGYYVALAKALDIHGNEGWSHVVPFSIRNWAVLELLPASESNKARRTMPVKFSLRIAESVDPAQPFVYNEELEIRIYDAATPGTILQTSLYGDTSVDYRIDSVGELYITNFKTGKKPAQYVVEIWRTSKNFLVGSFNFSTVK